MILRCDFSFSRLQIHDGVINSSVTIEHFIG
jgi:hypothetical protein